MVRYVTKHCIICDESMSCNHHLYLCYMGLALADS